MTLDTWLTLAQIGIAIIGGISAPLVILETWLVVQVFNLKAGKKVTDQRLLSIEQKLKIRLRTHDTDQLENTG